MFLTPLRQNPAVALQFTEDTQTLKEMQPTIFPERVRATSEALQSAE